MSISGLLFTSILTSGLLLAQSGSNTVTVTASQNSNSQPDQAIFNVTVGSGIDKSLDDIVKSVTSVGITAADLTGIGFPPLQAAPPQLQWSFQFSVALSAIKQTTASLAALQAAIAQSGGSLSFSVSGTQSSSAQALSCDFAGLIANAQAQAQASAAAAGSAAGRITGISGSTSQAEGHRRRTIARALGYSGNPGPHTISVAASRSASLVPDQAVILIVVQSPVGVGPDDVTGALTQAGVSGASLSSVGTETYTLNGKPQSYLLWSFTLTTPLANLKSAVAQLQAAQAAIAKQNSGLTISISSAIPQTSSQAQPVCSQAALVMDATAQAHALAAAAEVSVGTVMAISGGGVTAADVYPNPTVGGRLGAVLYTYTSTTCSTLVQFQLC